MKKAKIEQYLKLHEERRELQRRADALQKEADAIAKELVAHVDEHGGKARSCVTCGHRLSMQLKAGRVAWKEEFVDRLGIDEAEKLTKAALPTESLHVEPLQPAG